MRITARAPSVAAARRLVASWRSPVCRDLQPLALRSLASLALLLLLAGFAASGAAAAQTCAAATDFPTQFPIDSYVFVATVLEPVLLGSQRDPVGEAPLTRVEITAARHVPVAGRTFDLALFDSACRGLSRAELIDRFVSGDEIHVVAYPHSEEPRTLEAPSHWVRLADESLPRGIDTPFEYFVALLRLDGLNDDSQRTGVLRSIADFIEDPDLYGHILEAQLRRKSLRKQLLDVHAILHRDLP